MKRILNIISTRIFILFSAALFFSFSTIGYALDVTLEWDANTQPDLDHYAVFWGTSSGNYTASSNNIDRNTTTYTITGLTDGTTYYYAAKAYDDQGRESDYSNEVSAGDSAATASTSGDGNGGCFIATSGP